MIITLFNIAKANEMTKNRRSFKSQIKFRQEINHSALKQKILPIQQINAFISEYREISRDSFTQAKLIKIFR